MTNMPLTIVQKYVSNAKEERKKRQKHERTKKTQSFAIELQWMSTKTGKCKNQKTIDKYHKPQYQCASEGKVCQRSAKTLTSLKHMLENRTT